MGRPSRWHRHDGEKEFAFVHFCFSLLFLFMEKRIDYARWIPTRKVLSKAYARSPKMTRICASFVSRGKLYHIPYITVINNNNPTRLGNFPGAWIVSSLWSVQYAIASSRRPGQSLAVQRPKRRREEWKDRW